ncbi:MAG: hypothetical protein QME74_08815 [Candidatus Edwardsbacteria bacterium]|nr:hypothetical protein [Candidatus Edwardsbacteria bacterium]
MMIYTVIAASVPLVFYAGLLLNRHASESLNIYFFQRALARIQDQPTVSNRFTVLYHLLMELLPGILLTIVIWVGSIIMKKRPIGPPSNGRTALFFMLAGAAGSLPLMLTLVQKRFYFVHSLPLFAIGLALLIAPDLRGMLRTVAANGRARMIVSVVAIILLASAVSMSVASLGKAKRDQVKLHDIYQIGKIVPQGSLINVDVSMWQDWSLQCYLIRYLNVSVDCSEQKRVFSLHEKNITKELGPDYIKVDIPLKEFNLYRMIVPQ